MRVRNSISLIKSSELSAVQKYCIYPWGIGTAGNKRCPDDQRREGTHARMDLSLLRTSSYSLMDGWGKYKMRLTTDSWRKFATETARHEVATRPPRRWTSNKLVAIHHKQGAHVDRRYSIYMSYIANSNLY
jgi:hypothetical protein